MQNPLELFLFDLAGTTVADDGFVLRAFLQAARGGGLSPDPEWVRARMGLKKLAVFEEMLNLAGRPTSGAPELNADFERHIAEELAANPPQPLPGAMAAFEALARAGIRFGFTTGFSQTTARPLLDALGWPTSILATSDMVTHGRPAPDLIRLGMRQAACALPARVGIAGDTPSDLQAGAAAGCALIIGVGHGSHTLAELAPHPHTHLLPDLSNFEEVLHAFA